MFKSRLEKCRCEIIRPPDVIVASEKNFIIKLVSRSNDQVFNPFPRTRDRNPSGDSARDFVINVVHIRNVPHVVVYRGQYAMYADRLRLVLNTSNEGL